MSHVTGGGVSEPRYLGGGVSEPLFAVGCMYTGLLLGGENKH